MNKIQEIQDILEDLQMNHNHTWYEELYKRNSKWMMDTALFYRGNNISYGTMFKNMRDYAKALRAFGIHEGDEIPICIANIPELIYLLGAISIIGAKANIFGVDFDKGYITEIVDGCSSDLMFVLDNHYEEISDAINESKIKKVVMCSLVDSLPSEGNPYEEIDKKHKLIQDTRSLYMGGEHNIISVEEFVKSVDAGGVSAPVKCGLDSEFIITYTSGSTNTGRPKAIVHTTRSLITIGRCHDPEIQKTTSMKNFTIQAHIPCHSNTDIISSISDALMQGSKLALEPVYDKDFFIDTLLINRPTYVVATRSFWINTAKKVLFSEEYKDVSFPFMLIPFSVGEPLEINEERLINKAFRKTKAGVERVPLPFSIVTISVAGGDCEHGGIFWVLFRALRNLKLSNLLRRQEQGMLPFGMVDVAVLDSKGNKCKPYELGRLVANSPCNMKEYKNDPEATAKFFIKDADGKTWGDCRVYSYIDRQGGVHMKGRVPEMQNTIPLFKFAEEILKDRKNILSCEVVEVEERYVAHVEFVPNVVRNPKRVLTEAKQRCIKVFGKEDTNRILWRVRSNEEAFPLTGCGKRNVNALILEGTNKCFEIE